VTPEPVYDDPALESARHRREVRLWLEQHKTTLMTVLWGLLIPLSLFAALAEDVWSREPLRFDNPPLLWLHAHASSPLDALMLGVTTLGGAKVMAGALLLTFGVLAYLRRWGEAAFLFVATGGAEAFNLLLKALFHRSRPALWPSLTFESDFSFPSGHAMFSAAVLGAALVLLAGSRWRRPVLIAGGLFALLIGVSRVYLGVHYPSDVLAAWCAAHAWVTLSSLMWGRRLLSPQGASGVRACSAEVQRQF